MMKHRFIVLFCAVLLTSITGHQAVAAWAIAVGTNDAEWLAWGAATRPDVGTASIDALGNCMRHTGECELAAWSTRRCGALYMTRYGWGTGEGDEEWEARQEAWRQCQIGNPGKRCVWTDSFCY
jgi:hypothetical protein